MIDRLRKDPGLAFALLALVLAAAIYAPTVGRGLISYDDPWLVHDNWILQHPSWSSLRAVFFDHSTATRYVLGAEYLPVRDLSIMADFAIWGSWYEGFHLTSLVVYLAGIWLWFAALVRFGVPRTLAGLTILIFALHPVHAESVAWLAERKGLLALAWSGAAALGYAHYRAGGRARWLVLAAVAGVCAVWSKAPAAFALAGLVAFEVALPERRVSWRRSALGLAVIGATAGAAFVPVFTTALHMTVVSPDADAPAGWLPLVLGVHGFYVRLSAMAVPNAVSYTVSSIGPSTFDLVLGGAALVAVIAAAAIPRVPRPLRAAALFWLVTWFPNSRIALPVVRVLVADRYLMFGVLAVALAAAAGVIAVRNPRIRIALGAAIVLAGALRSLDAQASWATNVRLWERATQSNPHDGNAWSFYAEALASGLRFDLARRAVAQGLLHSHDPHLLHRDALLLLERGEREAGVARMREAASAGAPYAMSNLALLLMEDGKLDEAIDWARKATQLGPMYSNGHRILGKVLYAAERYDEALAAWDTALRLDPGNLGNRYNVGLVLVALHRYADARPYLLAATTDPRFAESAQQLLQQH